MNLKKIQIIYVLQIFLLINILHLSCVRVTRVRQTRNWEKYNTKEEIKETENGEEPGEEYGEEPGEEYGAENGEEPGEEEYKYPIEKTIDTIQGNIIKIIKYIDAVKTLSKEDIDQIHSTCQRSFNLLKNQIKEMSKSTEIFGIICFKKLKKKTTYLCAEVQSEIDKIKIRDPERAKRYMLKLEIIEGANVKGEKWWEMSDNIADQFNMISNQENSFDEFLIELRLYKISEDQSELKRCLERVRNILSELEDITNKKYLHEKNFINLIGEDLKP